MMDPYEEIRKAAERSRQVHSKIGQRGKQAIVGSSRLGVENGENIVPQLCNWAADQSKKSIQSFAEHRLCRRFTQKPPFRRGAKIQNLVSDGDSTSWPVRRFRENAKRKILKREVCSMVVGACNPATPAGDMRVIDSHILLPNMQRAGRSATEQQTRASSPSEKSVSPFSRSIEANGAGCQGVWTPRATQQAADRKSTRLNSRH